MQRQYVMMSSWRTNNMVSQPKESLYRSLKICLRCWGHPCSNAVIWRDIVTFLIPGAWLRSNNKKERSDSNRRGDKLKVWSPITHFDVAIYKFGGRGIHFFNPIFNTKCHESDRGIFTLCQLVSPTVINWPVELFTCYGCKATIIIDSYLCSARLAIVTVVYCITS